MNPELDPLVNRDPNTPPPVTIVVEVSELNLLLGALQELPHRVADPLLKKLFQQAQDQLKR